MNYLLHFIGNNNKGIGVVYKKNKPFFLNSNIPTNNITLNKYLCENRSSAIRAMEGKPTIGMLRQYYLLLISKSNWVLQISGFSLFLWLQYILLHKLYFELYLKLSQATNHTSCITIHSISSNSKQDPIIMNFATICSVHSVKSNLGIKNLTKWRSVWFDIWVQTFNCLTRYK